MRKKKTPDTTGILGADRGCGTTHLALALANTAASRLHKRTALVGFCSDALTQLLGDDFDYREGMYHFTCMGFEVFAPAGANDLSFITAQDYDDIIIDFGHSEKVSHEFAVCTRRYITGSLAPFRWRNLDTFFTTNTTSLSGMRATAVCQGNAGDIRRFRRVWKIRCIAAPFIPDPLRLSLRDANALAALLSDKS